MHNKLLQLSQALTIPENATKAAGQVFKTVGSTLSKVVATQPAGLGISRCFIPKCTQHYSHCILQGTLNYTEVDIHNLQISEIESERYSKTKPVQSSSCP